MMSDLAQVTKHAGNVANPPSFVRLSYHQIGLYAAIIDAVLILCASVLADLSYHFFSHAGTTDLEFGAGTGLAACIVFWLAARQCGLYSLPQLIASQPRWSALLFSWAAVALTLPLMLFLLKVGSVFSRGSMIVFACLGLVLLASFRLAAAPYLKYLIARRRIAGRRAVLVGEADELAALKAMNL